MKNIFLSTLLLLIFSSTFAQRIAHVPAQQNPIAIVGGTIHIGNGQIIENGTIVFDKGKIVYAGTAAGSPPFANLQQINAQGKQIYPGVIAPNSQLGLSEIGAARATNDNTETGTYNPGVRS